MSVGCSITLGSCMCACVLAHFILQHSTERARSMQHACIIALGLSGISKTYSVAIVVADSTAELAWSTTNLVSLASDLVGLIASGGDGVDQRGHLIDVRKRSFPLALCPFPPCASVVEPVAGGVSGQQRTAPALSCMRVDAVDACFLFCVSFGRQ